MRSYTLTCAPQPRTDPPPHARSGLIATMIVFASQASPPGGTSWTLALAILPPAVFLLTAVPELVQARRGLAAGAERSTSGWSAFVLKLVSSGAR